MNKVIDLADLIESRLKKEQELEYYRVALAKLQRRINALEKEVDITTLIIDMIETERVLTVDEKKSKIIQLERKQ